MFLLVFRFLISLFAAWATTALATSFAVAPVDPLSEEDWSEPAPNERRQVLHCRWVKTPYGLHARWELRSEGTTERDAPLWRDQVKLA
jgi:hypothetical protein